MSGFGRRSGNTTELQRSVAPAPAAAPAHVSSPSIAPGATGDEQGRTPFPSSGLGAPVVNPPPTQGGRIVTQTMTTTTAKAAPPPVDNRRSDKYYEIKGSIFGALIEAIDLAQ